MTRNDEQLPWVMQGTDDEPKKFGIPRPYVLDCGIVQFKGTSHKRTGLKIAHDLLRQNLNAAAFRSTILEDIDDENNSTVRDAAGNCIDTVFIKIEI